MLVTLAHRPSGVTTRFTDDTEDALAFVTALVNTEGLDGEDELETPEQLEWLLDEHRYSGRRDGDEKELAEVRRSRRRLRRFWAQSTEESVDLLNRMLADARALPQLVRHDSLPWHIHATDPEAPLAQRIEVEAALAIADVIRSNAMDQLRVCAAEDCCGVLVDLSRNGSKRFCSLRCGNRVNVSAYRERQATSSGDDEAP